MEEKVTQSLHLLYVFHKTNELLADGGRNRVSALLGNTGVNGANNEKIVQGKSFS